MSQSDKLLYGSVLITIVFFAVLFGQLQAAGIITEQQALGTADALNIWLLSAGTVALADIGDSLLDSRGIASSRRAKAAAVALIILGVVAGYLSVQTKPLYGVTAGIACGSLLAITVLSHCPPINDSVEEWADRVSEAI